MDAKESNLLDQFLSSLTEATGFRLGRVEHDVPDSYADRHRGIDALVELFPPDNMPSIELAVEIRNSDLYPRDVTVASLRLQAFKEQFIRNIEICLVANKLSPSSRESLQEDGINYFDTSGSLYFKVRPWFIHFERLAKSSGVKKPLNVFAGVREQVVHALLYHHHQHGPHEYISGVELAKLSHASGYTVTQTMRELEKYELVETQGSGPYQQRRAKHLGKLLDRWAEERSKKKPVVSLWYLSVPNEPLLGSVLKSIDGHNVQGVLVTGAAAANIVTPTLTGVSTVELIVPTDCTFQVAKELDLRPVTRGHNIQIIERDGAAHLFPMEDHRFASPFILYLDLLNGVGRNKELADAFRKETLRM